MDLNWSATTLPTLPAGLPPRVPSALPEKHRAPRKDTLYVRCALPDASRVRTMSLTPGGKEKVWVFFATRSVNSTVISASLSFKFMAFRSSGRGAKLEKLALTFDSAVAPPSLQAGEQGALPRSLCGRSRR
jgi:hypothetical protein